MKHLILVKCYDSSDPEEENIFIDILKNKNIKDVDLLFPSFESNDQKKYHFSIDLTKEQILKIKNECGISNKSLGKIFKFLKLLMVQKLISIVIQFHNSIKIKFLKIKTIEKNIGTIKSRNENKIEGLKSKNKDLKNEITELNKKTTKVGKDIKVKNNKMRQSNRRVNN